jgi:hypothetical protein
MWKIIVAGIGAAAVGGGATAAAIHFNIFAPAPVVIVSQPADPFAKLMLERWDSKEQQIAEDRRRVKEANEREHEALRKQLGVTTKPKSNPLPY